MRALFFLLILTISKSCLSVNVPDVDEIPCEDADDPADCILSSLPNALGSSLASPYAASRIEKHTAKMASARDEQGPWRLPSTVRPDAYWLNIRPYFPSSATQPPNRMFTFDGTVKIRLRASQPTAEIVLHTRNLNISQEHINVADPLGNMLALAPDALSWNATFDFLTIQLAEGVVLRAGIDYMLTISYTGVISDYRRAGLFRSEYVQPNGERHWIIVSHFESIWARTMYPCFDEPAMKAVFHVTVEHPSDLRALSNGMERGTHDIGGGWSRTMFAPSMKMSNYLLAIAVGDLVGQQRMTAHGTLVRVWAWPGMESYMDLALHTAVRVLEYYGNTLLSPFPMEKNDLLALPQFLYGGEENWGLVVFAHDALLFDWRNEDPTESNVVGTVSHELAHMWFGDLVTAKWWDDIFLNEGMTTYWTLRGAIHAFPAQEAALESAKGRSLSNVMLYDATQNTAHWAVHGHIGNPTAGPMKWLNAITYRKGAALFRMLQHTMGDKAFDTGLLRYLAKYGYGNAGHDDLWNELTKTAAYFGVRDWKQMPLNVSELMNPWIMQAHFPVIDVSSKDGMLHFTQSPVINASTLPPSEFSYQWHIPLWFGNSRQPDVAQMRWISPAGTCVNCTMPVDRQSRWEVENLEMRSYTAIRYDDQSWNKIIAEVKRNDGDIDWLTAETFLPIMLDVALQNGGLSRKALDVSLLLKHQHLSSAWQGFRKTLIAIDWMFRQHPSRTLVQRYFQAIMEPMLNKTNCDSGDWNDCAVHQMLEEQLCWRQFPSCPTSMHEQKFQRMLSACANSTTGSSPCNTIKPLERRAVYCSAVRNTDNFDRLWTLYMQELQSNLYFGKEAQNIMLGLTCTQDQDRMFKLLDHVFMMGQMNQGAIINAAAVTVSLAINEQALPLMWQYLETRVNITSPGIYITFFFASLTARMNTPAFMDKLELFFDSHQLSAQMQKGVRQAMDTVQKNMVKLDSEGRVVGRWLWDNFAPGTVSYGGHARLPTALRPASYSVHLQHYFPADSITYPQQYNLTFDGLINIDLNVSSATNKIVLNAYRLMIKKVELHKDSTLMPITDITFDVDNRRMTISLSQMLQPGESARLFVSYIGFINDYLTDGVFWNVVQQQDGTKRWMVATDFEAGPSTRSLMPLFDEPAFKAPFHVQIVHPNGTTAIANGMETSTIDTGSGWKMTIFDATPPMSSYLFAMAVGDLSSISRTMDDGTLVRMWTWPGFEHYSQLSLLTAVRSLKFFGDYFETPYPLPKMDVLAIPRFDGGAMENFGLVTSLARDVLDDPTVDITYHIADNIDTITHEFTHQWFGDLVTCKWWDDLFLNEASAEFWSKISAASIFPDQEEYYMEGTLPTFIVGGLLSDEQANTHPVVVDQVGSPFFDGITYSKGGALMHMLYHTMGDAFRKGLVQYLRTYRFGNADHEDFFRSLTNAARENNVTDWCGNSLNVSEFMDPWVLQASHPIIEMGADGTLSQRPFANTSTLPPSSFNYQWFVPVFTRTNAGASMTWVTPAGYQCPAESESNAIVALHDEPQTASWTILNDKLKAFTRVSYNEMQMSAIMDQLMSNPAAIATISRAQLIADAAALNPTNYSRILAMTQYLSKERKYLPWYSAARLVFKPLRKRLLLSPGLQHLDAYIQRQVAPIYQELSNWPISTGYHDNVLTRQIVDLACKHNLQQCLWRAQILTYQTLVFCEHSQNGSHSCTRMPPDVRASAYCAGSASLDMAAYRKLWALLEQELHTNLYFRQELISLLQGLSCASKQPQLMALLAHVLPLNSDRITEMAVNFLSDNAHGPSAILNYLMMHTEDVVDSGNQFGLLMAGLGHSWYTHANILTLQAFERSFPFKDAEKAIFQAVINRIMENMVWMNTVGQDAIDWLQSHSS